MRDIDYVEHKGRFNIKAITPRAREVMGRDCGGPWEIASECFFMHISPHRLQIILERLRSHGLQTEEEELDINKLTDF